MRFVIGPIEEMTVAPYKRNTSKVIASEVTMKFNALNDEDVYDLVKTLSEDLTGASRLTKFSVKRANRLTDESLLSITKTGAADLVEAELAFTWLGIAPIETDDDKDTNGLGTRR